MKSFFLSCLVAAMSLLSLTAFSQDKDKAKAKDKPKEDTTALLGLAGDNLDLYAVLEIFQKSKTIEDFEKSLNDEKLKINNLDLNLDKKVDFIKVVTKKKDNSYTFILQVDVSKKETQDVAVILLDKDKNGKVSLQIVGDEELYGKDYIIEPKGNSSVTANPGYTGDNPVTVNVPASTTVVVQSAPIVQYVYSPAYVPYAPPYYYGYYPPWFGFATVMAVGIYRSNHWGYGYHGGYYGGSYHGGNNNVIINNGNKNNFNNYNNNKMKSNTVANNRANGSYGNGAGAANRGGLGGPSASTRPANGGGNIGGGPSASTRPSSPSASTKQSSNFSSSSNRSSSSSFGGSSSGRSMSGGYSGGARGGGGGGRRR